MTSGWFRGPQSFDRREAEGHYPSRGAWKLGSVRRFCGFVEKSWTMENPQFSSTISPNYRSFMHKSTRPWLITEGKPRLEVSGWDERHHFFSPIGRPKNLNIRNTIRWSNLCHHGFKVPTAVLVGFESLGLAGFVHLTIAWGHDPRWFSTHFSMGPMQQIFGSLRYPPFQIKQIMAGWVGV
jgi:hypothetical protein